MSEHEDEFDRKEREYLKAEKELEDAIQVMNVLGDYVNYRKSVPAFIEAFKREHNTLQQSIFGMFLALMEEIANGNYRTDGRNEDSKKMAQQLLEGFKLAKKQEYISQGVSEARANDYVTTGDGAKPSRYLPHI